MVLEVSANLERWSFLNRSAGPGVSFVSDPMVRVPTVTKLFPPLTYAL
jgi:hypothetical protein